MAQSIGGGRSQRCPSASRLKVALIPFVVFAPATSAICVPLQFGNALRSAGRIGARIVSTVADLHGVLPRSLSELVRSRPPHELTPYEAVLRSFRYPQRPSPEELVRARAGLEAAVRKAPFHGDAWAMLSFLCVQDYAHGFKLQTDALAFGLTAARRAVEAAPSSHLSFYALAQALFFHKEIPGFRNAVERAVVHNPMDGNSLEFLGEMLVYSGHAERGLELAARAKAQSGSGD